MACRSITCALSIAVASFVSVATASDAREIRIGITGTFTGPAAAIGMPYKQAATLFPREIARQPVTWIVLDDGGDPSTAVKNAVPFIDKENVDAILGSTSPPGSIAMFDTAIAGKTPQLSLAPVPIPDGKRRWIFHVPQPVPIMVSAIVDHMATRKYMTVGFIGFADSWGDQNYGGLGARTEAKGIKGVST